MDSPSGGDQSKKPDLEHISKEELLKKYQFLLGALQKVKQAKAALEEENKSSDKNSASDEVIESLTQQKLELVTTLEEVRNREDLLQRQLEETKQQNSSLDTENQGFKRQIARLTDENEQLFADLAKSEKEIDELQRVGLEQREQLLALEKVTGTEEELMKLREENSLLKIEVRLSKVPPEFCVVMAALV